MLSVRENELISRVGPGTPMGNVLRRYWMPVCLSEELPEPDGAPVRVKAVGERLVAFRNSQGNVGLIQENCPHRSVSLFFARNEEDGLRCIYHGWKFDATGTCVDMPTEASTSNFKDKVRAQAYPVREVLGMVWAYLGPAAEQPEFPEFAWYGCGEGQVKASKMLEECNFVQAVEGAVDTVHSTFLHRGTPWLAEDNSLFVRDAAPRLEIQYTKYGFRYAGLRKADEEQQYVRITPFVMPWTTIVPGGSATNDRSAGGGGKIWNAFVAIDDYNTWQFQYLYNPNGPINYPHRVEQGGIWYDENYRKLRNIDNNYLQSQEMMKTQNFSGIKGILTQDMAVNESQGPICDRSIEHLGTTDIAIIAMRRMLVEATRSVEAGGDPPGVEPGIRHDLIDSEAEVMANERVWREAVPMDKSFVPERAS